MIKTRRRQAEMPMASMSDIAFLLIIFFITSISFVYRQGLRISLPKKDSLPVVLPAKDILILILDKDGTLIKNGKKITLKELDGTNESAAIIKVDKECPYKYLVSTLETLQKKDLTKLSIKKL